MISKRYTINQDAPLFPGLTVFIPAVVETFPTTGDVSLARLRVKVAGSDEAIVFALAVEDIFTAGTPEILSETTMRRLGALTVESDRSRAVADHVRDQRATYERYEKAALVEELLRRDENRLLEGRMMADSRMATNLLRELTRHLLNKADAAQISHLTIAARKGKQALINALHSGDGGLPGLVEGLLGELGAEPADLRSLRLHGTMLGSGKPPEVEAAEMEALASGELAHTDDATAGSARVGDDVRKHQDEKVVAKPPARESER